MAQGQIIRKVDKFLQDRRKSDGGGWAPVEEGDVLQLHKIIEELVNTKWGPDADGDRPVEWILVDRTRWESMSFLFLPYISRAQLPEELDRYIDVALTNVKIAMGRVEIAMRLRQDDRRVEALKKKDPS